MAVLVTASGVYPICGSLKCRPRASPRSDAIHVLLSVQTWMRGASPRMTSKTYLLGCHVNQEVARSLMSASGST